MTAWAPAGPATLLRALRSDVALRYVAVGSGLDAPAYDVLHEDGEPDGAGGVLLLGLAPEDDDGLRERWDALRVLLSAHRGYLGARLHRSRGPADVRLVTLVRWSSPLMCARALRRPEVAAAAAALPFPAALYLAVG